MNVIYVIQAGHDGPIKILTAKDTQIDRRLRRLQEGSVEILHLRHLIAGGDETPLELHSQLRPWRLHDDWYDPAALDHIPLDVGFDILDHSGEARRVAVIDARRLAEEPSAA